jgi:hypothetical protein
MEQKKKQEVEDAIIIKVKDKLNPKNIATPTHEIVARLTQKKTPIE